MHPKKLIRSIGGSPAPVDRNETAAYPRGYGVAGETSRPVVLRLATRPIRLNSRCVPQRPCLRRDLHQSDQHKFGAEGLASLIYDEVEKEWHARGRL